jgi:hypothetical protein
MRSPLSMYPMCLLQSCKMTGFRAFTCLSQKLPSAGGNLHVCQHVYILFVFPNYVVKLPFTLVFISPCFSLCFFQKSLGIPFQFGLTVPQQFMAFIHKSSNESGEDKKVVHVEFVSQIFNPCNKSCHCGSLTFPVPA